MSFRILDNIDTLMNYNWEV